MRNSVDITRGYQFGRMLLNHVMAVIVAFVIQTVACWYYLDKHVIKYIVSIIFVALYAFMIYSGAHRLATFDAKPYTPLKANIKWGVLWGAFIAVTIIAAAAIYWGNRALFTTADGQSLNNWGSVLVNLIMTIWISPYMGFLFSNTSAIWIIAAAASVVSIAASTFGYAAGMKNFDVIAKLDSMTLEKNEDDEDSDDNRV